MQKQMSELESGTRESAALQDMWKLIQQTHKYVKQHFRIEIRVMDKSRFGFARNRISI